MFANRIPRISRGLAVTLEKIAAEFATYLHILSYMGANYLHLLERLTPGEMFHLEREAHEAALPKVSEHALDRMLDAYNAWKSHPCAEGLGCESKRSVAVIAK